MNTATRPSVLVARAVFPDIVDRLRVHFEVEDNPDDVIFGRAELIRRLRGKQGAFTTGSERIDAELLDANPQLRVVCNMAVGYNNFDIPACTARATRTAGRVMRNPSAFNGRPAGRDGNRSAPA